MYNAAQLQEAFAGLVGFAQKVEASYSDIPAPLLASASGRILAMVHPLCTIENIDNCAPEFATVQRRNDWLLSIYNAGVVDMVSALIRWRKLEQANKTLLDSMVLYDGIGMFTDKIIKSGRFCALELHVSSQRGLQAFIDAIGLQADTVQDVPFYLYHSSVSEPIKTFTVSVQQQSSFNFAPVQDAMLSFYDKSHNASGVFYLGYYESDLVGQAYNRSYDWLKGPCNTCGSLYNTQAFNTWSKYVKIRAVSFPASALQVDKTLFDTTKGVQDGGNFGLNLSLSVACDLTEFFTLHKGLFADALAMQICLKLLAVIAYSTRMNAIPDKAKALAMADLDASARDSFAAKYAEELKALAVDFSGLNSACMPSQSKNTVRYSAV